MATGEIKFVYGKWKQTAYCLSLSEQFTLNKLWILVEFLRTYFVHDVVNDTCPKILIRWFKTVALAFVRLFLHAANGPFFLHSLLYCPYQPKW